MTQVIRTCREHSALLQPRSLHPCRWRIEAPCLTDEQLAEGLKRARLAERLDPSVVRIYVIGPQGMGSGTGFVVNREDYVATNFHVVELHTIGESNNPASKDRVDQMGCWTGLTGDPRCYLLIGCVNYSVASLASAIASISIIASGV